jgi:diaminopimelate decarboxylase
MYWESTGLIQRGNKLYVGKIECRSLAEEYGTPLYVMNEPRITDNIQRLRSSFTELYENIRIHYACKANSGLAVLTIVRQEGCHLDAVSPGEIYLSQKAGFKPDQVLFTGNNVKDQELSFALKANVRITLDSISEIRRLSRMPRSESTEVAIRINPEVGAGHHDHVITGGRNAKFGIWEEQAREAATEAEKGGLEIKGVHMHIGSGILDAEQFLPAIRRFMEIAAEVQEACGNDFEFIDLGGGIGVPYKPTDPVLKLDDFASKIVGTFLEAKEKNGIGGSPFLCLEPGRYIVADAGLLLTEVNTIKKTPHRTFVGVDAGFNDLIRPAMYGSYHHILNSTNMAAPHREVDVVGPLCESGDVFARDRKLPEPREGDILAILNAGAYGYSMSSQYNSRPRPAEVLVSDSESEVIRKREGLHNLVTGQSIPSRLRD